MSFLVEMVVDRAVNRGEFLQTSHAPEPEHRLLSSSKWLVGILGSVVFPTTNDAALMIAESLHRRSIRGKAIGHDLIDKTMASKRFSQEFQRRLLVTTLCDKALEHFSLMIDGAPEVVLHAIDLHEDLVEMPTSMPEGPNRLDSAPADFCRENCPEAVPPEPHRLMGDVDPALVEQVLDVPQRQRVADIHHHREADYLGARLEIPENTGVAHPVRLDALPVSGNRIFPLTVPA